ncbi:FAD-dependent oxidoreductase [Azohydromonas caseinilytica]|uniref:FAD-dependent oxidoreductase n=1 Tax=Azohydromonas caseinilytica TaxID=2728836 RepID=A0A848F634_9BURK|nr:FAD-dependent oxidoreductase [Azohydromonas caseinilytica]NML13750.1 FAD-dependent oxidoreductase [Azohydromonas caseinilytica]
MAALSIGIAGAGLLGRLLAWRLSRAGHRVTVFDPAPGPAPGFDGTGAAGFTAAGMLSPLAELDNATPALAAQGWRAIGLWQAITQALDAPSLLRRRGSLMLAHRSDLGAAQRVLARLETAPAGFPTPQPLAGAELAELEPALQAGHAWLLPDEGQVDTVATLEALHRQARGVAWRWGRRVAEVSPGRLACNDGEVLAFDLAIDVRGAGARPALPVRGVRGETVWLRLEQHGLTRPVRLLHPRHRVYLVPRSADLLILGASEVESEDRSPVSLKSAVELMSAAHSVMPALAEARIERLDRNLRPALPDNEPRIEAGDGLLRLNGLFRHGWLLAPALVEDALAPLALPTLEAVA